MGRTRQYASNAERQRAYRERRSAELLALRHLAEKKRRPRHDFDVYETPPAFVRAGLDLVTTTPRRILDPGAGDGRWGAAARRLWPDAHLIGVELRDVPAAPAYDEWLKGDFRTVGGTLPPFDLVIGNPPYRAGQDEAFIRLGLQLLSPCGELVFLLRAAFNQGVRRAAGLFTEHPLAELCQPNRRPTFYGNGTGQTPFAFYRWQRGHSGPALQTRCFIEADL